MLLAIDVGNTDIKIGVFSGESLRGEWRWSTDPFRMADEYGALLGWALAHAEIRLDEIERAVLSSVVPRLTTTFRQLCTRYLGKEPLCITSAVDIGMVLAVDNPAEVGGDRIANALAARELYRAPAIVVDFGTATNFDVVSGGGAFLGGSFAPGILTALDALLSRAARLQGFDLVAPPRAIGSNTVACLQSGTIFGYVGLVDGLVQRIRAELDQEPVVIGTGGLVELIAPHTSSIKIVDRNLTLKGLQLLDARNASR